MIATATRAAVLLLALAMAAGCSNSEATSAPRSNAEVQAVTDGDTVSVIVGGQREKVRLIGVDTPETVHPTKPQGCFGKEASAFTKSLLPKGTPVNLVLDVEPRDRFGRLLAYLYRAEDGMFVNGELARQGYAQPLSIPPNVAHAQEFVAWSAEARQGNRGLWASCRS